MQLLLTLFRHVPLPDSSAWEHRHDLRDALRHVDLLLRDGSGRVAAIELKNQLDQEVLEPALYAQLLNYAATLQAQFGDSLEAQETFGEALRVAHEADDERLIVLIGANTALTGAERDPDTETARDRLRSTADALDAAGEQDAAARTRNNIGVVALAHNNNIAAIDEFSAILAGLRRGDHQDVWVATTANLGAALMRADQPRRARDELRAGVDSAALAPDRALGARLMINLAAAEYALDNHEVAQSLLDRARRHAQRAGDTLAIEAAARNLDERERRDDDVEDDDARGHVLVAVDAARPTPSRPRRPAEPEPRPATRTFEDFLLAQLDKDEPQWRARALQTLAGLRDLSAHALSDTAVRWAVSRSAPEQAELYEWLSDVHRDRSIWQRINDAWEDVDSQQVYKLLSTWSEREALKKIWFVEAIELGPSASGGSPSGQQGRLVEHGGQLLAEFFSLSPQLIGQRVSVLAPGREVERLPVRWSSNKRGLAVSDAPVRAGRVQVLLGELEGDIPDVMPVRGFVTSLNGAHWT